MSSPPVAKVAKVDQPSLTRVSASSQDYVVSYPTGQRSQGQEYTGASMRGEYPSPSVRTQDYVPARSAVGQPQYFRPSQVMDYTFTPSPGVIPQVYAPQHLPLTQSSASIGLQELTALPQYLSQLQQFNTAQYPGTVSQFPAPTGSGSQYPPPGARYPTIDYTQYQPGPYVVGPNYSAILASMGSHAQQVQGHKVGSANQQTLSSAFSPSESSSLHRQPTGNDSSSMHRHSVSETPHRPNEHRHDATPQRQTESAHRHNTSDKHGPGGLADHTQTQQQTPVLRADLAPSLSHGGQHRFPPAASMGQGVGVAAVGVGGSPDHMLLARSCADYVDSYRELKERGHDKLPAKMQAKLSSAQERAARHSPHLSGKQGASPTPDHLTANKYSNRPPGGNTTPDTHTLPVECAHTTHSPWLPGTIRPHPSSPSTKHNPTLLHQGQQSIQPPHGAPNFLPHFKKGSMIQLASGDLKRIEDMKTEDFVSSVKQRDDLKIDSSTVVRIEELPQTGMAMLHFSIEEYITQVKVEAALEHPFFVFGQGWSSVNPNKTMYRYSLPCHALKVGDICISLSNKHKNGTSPDPTGPALSKPGGVYPQSSLTMPSGSGTIQPSCDQLDGPKQELRPLSIHDPHRSAFQPQVPTIIQMVKSRSCKPAEDDTTDSNIPAAAVEDSGTEGEIPRSDSVGSESRPTRKRRWSCPDYPSSRDGEEHSPPPKQQP